MKYIRYAEGGFVMRRRRNRRHGIGKLFIISGIMILLAMILPVYKLLPLLLCAAAAIAVFTVLSGIRRSQIAKLPPAPTVKVRAEELAKNIFLTPNHTTKRLLAIRL